MAIPPSRTAAVEATSQTLPTRLLHPVFIMPALPFLNGGVAGMTATAIIQPIDMIKVRLQLAGKGLSTGPRPTALTITSAILASGRIQDLYTGLSAGLLRQAIYTTARLGLFDHILDALTARHLTTSEPTFADRALAGLAAGGLAATLSNPADLALIRMQSDGLAPLAARQNYSSALNALTRITRSEGLVALWAGCRPTVARAMALNLGQLAIFSEAKNQLRARTEASTLTATLTASAAAGFVASVLSLPFDFVKTRLQGQGQGGSERYRGMWDCARRVAREEGLGRFYRGFGTYYFRIAPHA